MLERQVTDRLFHQIVDPTSLTGSEYLRLHHEGRVHTYAKLLLRRDLGLGSHGAQSSDHAQCCQVTTVDINHGTGVFMLSRSISGVVSARQDR